MSERPGRPGHEGARTRAVAVRTRPTPAGLGRATLPASLVRGALLNLLAGLGLTLALSLSIARIEEIDAALPLRACAVFCAMAGLVLFGLHDHGHERFGAANIVTTLRAVLAAVLAAPLFEADHLAAAPDRWAWGVVSVALFAVLLDGFDGILARRSGLASSFGGRFDMEVDAFLIFVLSAFALALDRVGAWILLIGLARYLFIVAGWTMPFMAAPLPPSVFRKAVCVVQGLGLCMVLMPIVPADAAPAIGAVTLAALLVSFSADILWLWRRR